MKTIVIGIIFAILLIVAITLFMVLYVQDDNPATTKALWVAVGNDDTGSMENVLYSENGIDWKPASMETSGICPFYDGDGSGVAYNGTNRWVAVGFDFWEYTSDIVYSNDGIKWNKAAMVGGGSPFGLDSGNYGRGRGVAYGNNKWVAVGNDAKPANHTSNILWSTDGTEWNTACMQGGGSPFGNTAGRGRGVAYNNSDKWVAVGFDDGNSTSKILWSADGIEWDTACMVGGGSPFGTGNGYGVAYNGSIWVAVGEDVGNSFSNILYSSDGIEWISSYMQGGGSPFGTSPESKGNGVAYGGNKWIAVGNDDGSSTKNILYSSDGIEWKDTNGDHFSIEGLGVAYKTLLPN